MGLDWESIAIPLGAAPVRFIRADPELWEIADLQPPFCRPWPGEVLPPISRDLLAVVPAGSCWVHHFGDRSHEQAEYVLDPAAYRRTARWEERQQTTAFRIIRGEQAFAEHARSGQGIPWRCSGTAFLAVAVTRIAELDLAAIRREFSVGEMADLGLYKVHRDEDDDHAFTRILNNLHAYATYLHTVVTQKLDLIITLS